MRILLNLIAVILTVVFLSIFFTNSVSGIEERPTHEQRLSNNWLDK